jgi:hypothetical protein
VGGGLGLPLFDAVVFHARPLTASGSSVAPEGTPAGHTQVCVLDHAGVVRHAIAASGPLDPPALPLAIAVVPAPASLAASHDPTLLPPSRAPPISA